MYLCDAITLASLCGGISYLSCVCIDRRCEHNFCLAIFPRKTDTRIPQTIEIKSGTMSARARALSVWTGCVFICGGLRTGADWHIQNRIEFSARACTFFVMMLSAVHNGRVQSMIGPRTTIVYYFVYAFTFSLSHDDETYLSPQDCLSPKSIFNCRTKSIITPKHARTDKEPTGTNQCTGRVEMHFQWLPCACAALSNYGHTPHTPKPTQLWCFCGCGCVCVFCAWRGLPSMQEVCCSGAVTRSHLPVAQTLVCQSKAKRVAAPPRERSVHTAHALWQDDWPWTKPRKIFVEY